MTGRSWLPAAVTACWPSPGIENTSSISTVPPSRLTSSSPTTVTTGIAALRSACLSTTERRDRPRARSITTNSRDITSDIESRVCLATNATAPADRVRTGSAMLRSQARPGAERHVPGRGEHLDLDREQFDQHQGEPEVRERQAGQGHDIDQPAERPAPQRADDAQAHSDHAGDDHRREDERQAGRQAGVELLDHRLAAEQVGAEAAV